MEEWSKKMSAPPNAEVQFYRQIERGDPYAPKDLDHVIKMQTKLRKLITKQLPPLSWKDKEQ